MRAFPQLGAQQAKVNLVFARDASQTNVSILTRMGLSLPPPLGRPGSGPALPPCPPLQIALSGPAPPALRNAFQHRGQRQSSGAWPDRGVAGGRGEPGGEGSWDQCPLFLPERMGPFACHIPSADSSYKTASCPLHPYSPFRDLQLPPVAAASPLHSEGRKF